MRVKIRQWNHNELVPPDMMDQLMTIEEVCFKPEIQESYESKRNLIEQADIVLFAYDGPNIIGEAYTATSAAGDMGEEGDPDAEHLKGLFELMDQEDAVYCMSLAVLPDYRGQGVAKQLLWDTIQKCKESRFNLLYSHAKVGPSAHLFGLLGGQCVEERENWCGTGDTYILFRIPLWPED